MHNTNGGEAPPPLASTRDARTMRVVHPPPSYQIDFINSPHTPTCACRTRSVAQVSTRQLASSPLRYPRKAKRGGCGQPCGGEEEGPRSPARRLPAGVAPALACADVSACASQTTSKRRDHAVTVLGQ